ncbi:PIN domain-containing protein [Mycolicibacterium tusciae]|uniref:PIN domain-containing protein n=1 Tax=Mycolicibacterium tusciae TaxID=75922 RepID=UPI00024A2273|nr:PIN domain-containing protein [Mycolicibacterium tusciae]
MNVFDASALLAFLQDETGASTVERELDAGGHCGAANWSEVAQKVLAHGRDWELAKALLLSYDLGIADVSATDAEWAAHRWRRGEGLSVADRLCLALGERLDAAVWTADTGWEPNSRIHQIRE